MTRQEEKTIMQDALTTWGIEAQEMMLIEECGELLNAVAKQHRHRMNHLDVITELADVSIMVEQMAMHYGEDLFLAERERKLQRLHNRLELNRKQK